MAPNKTTRGGISLLNFPKKSLSGPPPTGGLFAVRTTHTVKLKNE